MGRGRDARRRARRRRVVSHGRTAPSGRRRSEAAGAPEPEHRRHQAAVDRDESQQPRRGAVTPMKTMSRMSTMTKRMTTVALAVACAVLWPAGAFAQVFTIPDRIEKLSEKAKESTNITLDGALLKLASAFLNSNDKDQRAAKEIVGKLKSIHVRNFEFERDNEYSDADLDPIRSQLKSPGWSRIVEQRERNEHTQIFVKIDKEKVGGLVILSA